MNEGDTDSVVALIETGRLPRSDLDRISAAVRKARPQRRGVLAAQRQAERDEIARRKKDNEAIVDIARAMGVTPSKVNRICHDYRIKKGVGYVD